MAGEKYLSVPEAAKLIGISRVGLYKKIKRGEVKAIRVGRSYAIAVSDMKHLTGKELTADQKRKIDQSVKKTVREYGDVLKRLGRE